MSPTAVPVCRVFLDANGDGLDEPWEQSGLTGTTGGDRFEGRGPHRTR